MQGLIGLIQGEEGATALEYGLLAALVSTAIATAVGAVGSHIATAFQMVSTAITAVTGS